MIEVKDVRAALERLRNRRESNTGLESAIVSEGLAACDEYETPAAGHDMMPLHCVVCAYRSAQLDVFSAILRKAGLL